MGEDGTVLLDNLACRMFRAERMFKSLECEVEETIITVMGKNPSDYHRGGFGEITYDEYDGSFELKSCVELFALTDEQQASFKKMGFQRAWLCTGPSGAHNRDEERYYYFGD